MDVEMAEPKLIYLIGSLRNPEIPKIGNRIRELGYDVFDDWHAGGPEADDEWQRYERERGRSYDQALLGRHAEEMFNIDYRYLNRCHGACLVLPAGKSGHLEMGYVIGMGKPGWIVYPEEPERYDLMYRFALGGAGVCLGYEVLYQKLKDYTWPNL
jgi:hypothetical protein